MEWGCHVQFCSINKMAVASEWKHFLNRLGWVWWQDKQEFAGDTSSWHFLTLHSRCTLSDHALGITGVTISSNTPGKKKKKTHTCGCCLAFNTFIPSKFVGKKGSNSKQSHVQLYPGLSHQGCQVCATKVAQNLPNAILSIGCPNSPLNLFVWGVFWGCWRAEIVHTLCTFPQDNRRLGNTVSHITKSPVLSLTHLTSNINICWELSEFKVTLI